MDELKARESRARRKLAKEGYRLRKSRTNGNVYVNGCFAGINIDNKGGYRIITMQNMIVSGEKFDLSIEDVEKFISE